MKALELFAGVGGITHGLRGYVEPVAFVEYEKDAAEFLATRGEPVHGDVKEFDATEYKGIIDIVTAGWPCTGFSTGGKGGGFDHEASGLFVEVVRIVRECDPRYVFLENSHVLSQVPNLSVVVGELHALGYDCRWYSCYSNDVHIGAPHQRYRWFCLAFKRELGISIHKVHAPKFDWSSAHPQTQEAENSRVNKRLLKLMGNSVVPSQVRHSFETMLDMGDTGVPVTPEDVHARCGYAKDGIMFRVEVDQKKISPADILLEPKDVPEKHRVPDPRNILTSPVTRPFWNTPVLVHSVSPRGNKVLTKRSSMSLPTQVSFYRDGDIQAVLSGKFSAWLMGYDPEYLGYLCEY
ncbi:cytosine-specific methyltransferase [Acanthocystis turfacea Chlorella virus MN0810.1]|nr:cytosine-specific methyltransferase [Acanthocystis turfacea Chlorella virus MN0810.1]